MAARHIVLWDWLEKRVGVEPLLRVLRKKEVPIHRHTIWYYLGGMAAFLFVVQLLTGTLLLLYYRPSAGEAYESVQFIMAEVQFGWLIRSIHSWAAHLMIFVLFIHLFSVLLLRAYRLPRELTWMSGVLLLAIVLGFGFTGYLLPWNELAFFATKVGTEMTAAVPVVGQALLRILRGGDEVSGATLTRFYAVHIAILPAACIAVLMFHLFLVQKHGMSLPERVERGNRPKGILAFFPNFLLRDLIGWLSALAILFVLAAFLPAELGEKADPFAPTPPGIKPEWYFMFMFQTLKLLPAHVLGVEGEVLGVFGLMLVGLALLLLPLLDRRTVRGGSSRLHLWIGLGMLAYIVILTLLGYAPGFAT